MKKYKVLVADSLSELEEIVTQHMNQYLSWSPIGGVFIHSNGDTIKYYQTMVY